MGHSYFNNLVHIVFSTKERRKIITPDKQHELWRYQAGVARNLGIDALAIGGIADHVHALVVLKGTIALSEFIQRLKANSSRWMSDYVKHFAWPEG
jgi:REP element-mobilizing transposase RayT